MPHSSPGQGHTETASVVLVGPSGAGKSTVAPLLAERLGYTAVDLDDLRALYYADLGYDHSEALAVQGRSGLHGLTEYWTPYEIASVERVMRDHPRRSVIAFGAGQSVFTEGPMLERARRALAGARAVVRLLPDADPERSLRVLTERIARAADIPADVLEEFAALNYSYVTSASTAELATHTVITGDLTPQDVADAVRAVVPGRWGGRV